MATDSLEVNQVIAAILKGGETTITPAVPINGGEQHQYRHVKANSILSKLWNVIHVNAIVYFEDHMINQRNQIETNKMKMDMELKGGDLNLEHGALNGGALMGGACGAYKSK